MTTTELTGVRIMIDGVPVEGRVDPDSLIEMRQVESAGLGLSFFARVRDFEIVLPIYGGEPEGFADFALGLVMEVSERLGIPIEDLLEDTDMNGIQEPESVHDAAELAVLSGGSAFDYDFDFDEACQNVEAVREMVEDSDQ